MKNSTSLFGAVKGFTFRLFLVLFPFFPTLKGWGQITVTITGITNTTPNLDASYTSFANFVTALNSVTAVSGSVTATLSAGSSETAPVKGFNISTSTANVFNTTNTLTIIKAAGAATTINAGVGTASAPSASSDGMMYLSGMDGVTIDGLTFTDGNSASATVAMEFGIAFFKRAAGDGCNGNTIQNCTFNMQRISNGNASGPMTDGSCAIQVLNSTPSAAITHLTPTNGGTLATNGTNSNNKFYSNTINGGNAGIHLGGFAATSGVGPTPTATTFLGDLGNDIGGTGVSTFTNGNSILNFGGGATSNAAVGIRANNQWSLNVSNNTVNNNNGSGTNHATTLRGIYLQAGTSANVTCTYNIVTIQSGATTSSCTAIDNSIGSTAASNQVDINNNIIRIGYATATNGVMTGISNTSSAATVNINLNNIQKVTGVDLAGTGTHVMIETGSPTTANTNTNVITNLTRGGASGNWRGIKTTSPGTWNADGNTIDGLSWTAAGSTGSIDAMYSFSSALIVNITNNIIRNLSTPTTGTITGINEFGGSAAKTFTGNQIYSFSTTAGGVGGATFRGISESTGTTNTFTNNLIYSLNSTGSTGGTSGTIVGITVSSGTTNNFTRNAIYDLSTTSTNPTVSGITLAGGTTNNVSNNLIGDLRSTASTNAVGLAGILVSSGTTNNIFHNTVNLNATGGTTFGSSGIYFNSSTPINNFRNNIIVNTSTPGSTSGITAAIRYITAPTSTNFPAANNNNLYFVGTAAANKVLYADNTTLANNQQTIAGYKTYINTTLAVAGREAGSVSENPSFISTAGSNPITTFLQYPTGTALQLEQGGGIGTGISTDFTGTTVRCPGGSCPGSAAAPDMGAWELNGTAADLTGPSISYTALSNTLCTNGQSLTATITDASGVNTTAGTKPRIYFKKSTDANTYLGNTSADNGWKFVESSSSASPFSFTIDASLLQSSLAAADVIQYFVVAQDLATVPNIGVNSGTFAAAPSSVALTSTAFALTGTINSYTINSAVATAVTIGTAGTYPSITGAGGLFAAINAGGLSGNTIATIIDASVTESGTVALNQITYGCTANSTLTIKPQTTATLTGSVASGALIKLNGADYVTIDGSNSGGTDRSLTITNTSTTNPTGVWIGSLGTGSGAVNNTIKNCIINTNGGSTAIPVMIGSATTWGSSGDDNDNLIVQNNQLNSVNYGVYAYGNSTGVLDNLNISSNIISITSTLSPIFGIRVGQASGAAFSGNTINATTSGATAPVAISIETGVTNSSVTANQITSCTTTATNGWGGRGISVGTGTASSNITIANNFIAGVNGSNFTGFGNSSSAGIMIGVLGNGSTLTTITGGVKIYHNSVNMAGSYTYAGACLTAGLYIGSGASALDIRNNILVNSMNNSNASGTTSKNYAIYSAVANTAFSNINYNDYFVSGSQGVLSFIGSDLIDLAALTSAFGGNANSMNINPQFVSATDLHVNSGSTQTQLESGGIAISGLTTDIDGQTRPGPSGSTNGGGTAPDIGADEFDGVPLPQCTTPTIQASAVTITNLSATSSTVSFTAGNGASYLVVTATGSAPSNPVDGTTYALNSAALGAGTTVVGNGTATTYNLTGLTAGQAYTVYVYTYNNTNCSNGPDYATPAATAAFTTCPSTIATAPVSSAASNVGPYGFTANWNPVSGWTPTNYVLDVALNSSFTSFVSGYNALNVSNVSSLNVTGLQSGTSYFYRVRATDGTCTTPNSSTQNPSTLLITSVATGNWNSGSTWSGGIAPTCNDIISIESGHNVTVNSSGNVSRNLTIASGGTLTIASGDLTVGCTLNNTPLTNNGTLTVSGGTLNVNGNIVSNLGSTFNQSGGNINIDGNNGGSATGSVASGTPLLNLLQLNSGINWTGGTLTIVDPHTATTNTNGYAVYYSNSTTGSNYPSTNHIIQFGNGVSTDAGGNSNGFYLDNWYSSALLPFGKCVVNGPTGTNRIVTIFYPYFQSDVTINNGGILTSGGEYFILGGDLTVNNGGLFIANYPLQTGIISSNTSTTYLPSAPAIAQTFGGAGSFQNLASSSTANLTSLFINNTSSTGVTLSAPISISGTLTMTAGKINTTATNLLTLGNSTSAGTLTYTAGQIVGPFARTFAASSNTNANYNSTTLFPLGDGINILPIHVDPITNSGGSVVIQSQLFSQNNGSAGAGVSSQLSSNRWEAIITSGSSNLTSCFVQLNDPSIQNGNVIIQSNSSNGVYNVIPPLTNYQTPNNSPLPSIAIRTAAAIPLASYSGYFAYSSPGTYLWTGATSTDPSVVGNWSPAALPLSNASINIPSGLINYPNYVSPAPNTLTINTGTTYTLQSGARLSIDGTLTNNGTLTLESGATLVQGASSTLAGTGTYNVKQDITGANNGSAPSGRFWYLGSPVTLASSSVYFGNAANVVKKRDEVNNAWTALSSGTPENLVVGQGYYTQAMGNATINFTGGLLNNGAITIGNLTRTAGQGFEGFNLVSNPYPSYLDWDAVTKTDVGNTMWYRTASGSTAGSMVFDTYVAGTGGIGTNLNGAGVSNLIPPMQSFWVRVNSGSTTGSLGLTNSMRAHFTSINGSVAGLKSTSNERDLFLRMNLLQANKKDQIIVYVNEIATNGFDQFDGEKMMQAGMPQFYTSAAGKKITINGLNSAKKQQALPITMELPTTGVHSFVIEDLEISNGLVWLEDKQEEIMQALEPGTVYEFYANSGINAERFVLHFQLIDDATPVNVYNEVNSSANFSGKGASVHAESAGVVVIKLPASTEGVTDIQIRDAAGKLVYTGSTNTLETSVQLAQANGIYYVTLNSASGVEVRKVFIQQ